MTHFYMTYFGNKRKEMNIIYKNLNFDNIDTIIEPFCGSCAISFYIANLNPGKYKYILNDNNPYLKELYEIIIDDEKSEKFENEYNETIKKINNKEDYMKT